jgi:hypothetical protein
VVGVTQTRLIGLTPRPGPLLARWRSLRCSRGCRQTIAPRPVMARPTMSVFTSRVPS